VDQDGPLFVSMNMINAVAQHPKQSLGASEEVTPEVLRLPHRMVNSYLVGRPGAREWALVDAGFAKISARKIIKAAEQRFGADTRPTAIILTHGHFDHVGAVEKLARKWNVPVYAHPLEMPYLTGRSAYPPGDPTVGGGMMSRLAQFYPRKPIDLGNRVRPLPADDSVPGMPGWRWIHTPGHSPGHISLFRERDKVLLAGDAFVTVKQESVISIFSQRQTVSRPPAYCTSDWAAARHSVRVLANLEPEIGATGHGIPMRGITLRLGLRALASGFEKLALPAQGRYVHQPAIADERGVLSLPPAVPDPLLKIIGLGLAALVIVAVVASVRARRQQEV
jgi:glyoxylase-like metal-dependent hydrolase (beta-lactamase superfamily II)